MSPTNNTYLATAAPRRAPAEPLRAVERIGEQRHLGLPAEPRQLGLGRTAVCLFEHTAHRSSRATISSTPANGSPRPRRSGRGSPRRTPSRAHSSASTWPKVTSSARHAEGDERRDERLVGVEQRAVEVEDRTRRQASGPVTRGGATTDDAAGSAPELAARRVLVPAGTARHAHARVEPQRRQVQPVDVVGVAVRALKMPGVGIATDRRWPPSCRCTRIAAWLTSDSRCAH